MLRDRGKREGHASKIMYNLGDRPRLTTVKENTIGRMWARR